MRRLALCLPLSCLTLLLAACSSAPVHFYTLLPPAPATDAQQMASYRIAVLPVDIPAQVDRPQMVVRQGSGSVALLEGERWIAPLGDEIRNALSGELSRRLGAEDVYGLAHAGDMPVYRIQVNIQRFESVLGQYTSLSAAWSVHVTGDKQKTASCTSRIREPVGQGYAALAMGHQRGLQALAGRIATVVQSLVQGHAANCAPATTIQSGS